MVYGLSFFIGKDSLQILSRRIGMIGKAFYILTLVVAIVFFSGCSEKNPTETENLTVSSPLVSHPSGEYYSPFLVQISCPTENAVIRYSTDGSVPGTASPTYTAPLRIESTTVLTFRAYKTGWKASAAVMVQFRFVSPPQPESILIAGGSFIMGNTHGNGMSSEIPFHRVTLRSFYLDKFEVTQAQFRDIMGFNQSYFSGDTLRPAEQISWYDAIEFCNKRSVMEGYTPCYSYSGLGTDTQTWPSGWNAGSHNEIICDWTANGYRLPSEAEWEFAAKGGINNVDLEYAGSNNADSIAWYSDNSDGKTHPIGLKQPNQLGFYDLCGNVWEWCWDWAGDYTAGDQNNPHGSTNGNDRILRGGSWYYNSSFLRVNLRGMMSPVTRYLDIGFRCARNAE